MFNARPQTIPTTEAMIISAQPGHSVFHFSPPAATKPSALALAELLTKQLFPVTAWRVIGDITEPLSIAAPPPGATVFLFSGAKIYQLGDERRCWDKRDQWEAALLFEWTQQRGVKEPQPQPVRQLTLDPGQGAVISRSGYF